MSEASQLYNKFEQWQQRQQRQMEEANRHRLEHDFGEYVEPELAVNIWKGDNFRVCFMVPAEVLAAVASELVWTRGGRHE